MFTVFPVAPYCKVQANKVFSFHQSILTPICCFKNIFYLSFGEVMQLHKCKCRSKCNKGLHVEQSAVWMEIIMKWLIVWTVDKNMTFHGETYTNGFPLNRWNALTPITIWLPNWKKISPQFQNIAKTAAIFCYFVIDISSHKIIANIFQILSVPHSWLKRI